MSEIEDHKTVIVMHNGKLYTFQNPQSSIIDSNSGVLFIKSQEGDSYAFGGTYMAITHHSKREEEKTN